MADLQTLELRINDCEENIDIVTNSLQSLINTLNQNMEANSSDIDSLLSELKEEDREIHLEIHEVANLVDGNESRISDLEIQLANLNNLSQNINSLYSMMDELELHLHTEIHRVAAALDSANARIDNMNGIEDINNILESLLYGTELY